MGSHDPVRPAEARAQLLASIVDHAGDAIFSVDPAGAITSWNDGATRLLGYVETEAIGRPMMTMVTTDRHAAELEILARVHRTERVVHHTTFYQHKNGSFVELSIAVSPIRNAEGDIVGMSLIARNAADGRRVQEEQTMLLREMGHRIRNLFALAGSVIALTARFARTPQDMADAARNRLDALARAHDLTLPTLADTAHAVDAHATLHALIRTIVAPYDEAEYGGGKRVTVRGPDVAISGAALASLALLLHEFATNAAKYGALSSPAGHVEVASDVAGEEFRITWQERGGPTLAGSPVREGFGSMLGHATVQRQLDGSIVRDWHPEGLTIHLAVPLARLMA